MSDSGLETSTERCPSATENQRGRFAITLQCRRFARKQSIVRLALIVELESKELRRLPSF